MASSSSTPRRLGLTKKGHCSLGKRRERGVECNARFVRYPAKLHVLECTPPRLSVSLQDIGCNTKWVRFARVLTVFRRLCCILSCSSNCPSWLLDEPRYGNKHAGEGGGENKVLIWWGKISLRRRRRRGGTQELKKNDDIQRQARHTLFWDCFSEKTGVLGSRCVSIGGCQDVG